MIECFNLGFGLWIAMFPVQLAFPPCGEPCEFLFFSTRHLDYVDYRPIWQSLPPKMSREIGFRIVLLAPRPWASHANKLNRDVKNGIFPLIDRANPLSITITTFLTSIREVAQLTPLSHSGKRNRLEHRSRVDMLVPYRITWKDWEACLWLWFMT